MKNDHKTLKSLAVLWLIALAPLMVLVPMIPGVDAYVKVDTSSSSRALQLNTQRKLLYDGTYWWLFYYNGTHVVSKYSSDAVTWSSNVSVLWTHFWGFSETNTGGTDVKIYGNTIYAVGLEFSGAQYRIFFQNGTISGSTITWNTTEVQIVAIGTKLGGPSVTRATTGRIWVSTISTVAPQILAFKSDNGGKTWSNDIVANSQASSVYTGTVISAMASGRVMVFYHTDGTPAPGYSVYTGAWSASAVINVTAVMPTKPGGFSLTANSYNPDIQYLAYLDTTGSTIRFGEYNSGWSALENVTGVVPTDSFPSITFDSTNNSTIVGWIQSDVLYARTRSSAGVWGDITLIDNMTDVNVIRPDDLAGSIKDYGGRITYAFVTGSGSPYNVSVAYLTVPHPLTPQGTLELSGLKCGDIWVTPDKTYLTVTATVQAQTPIQNVSVRFNDSLNMIQADYDNTTARWNLSQGRDYVSLNPQATATSTYTAAGGVVTTNNYTLQVQFMFLANERILDKNDVEIQFEYALQNGSSTSWLTNATMNIYNKGGATQYVIQNNAGFLPGGDVYSVYAKNSSSISVNQTWVRLQHLHANFAIRLVLNTTNSGEDNLWQDFAHKGANEYYTNSTDWTLYYKIWYYDEQNGAWVQGWIVAMKHTGGDLGSSDEWTQFNVTFYNGPNSEQTASQNMSAWVEREPEARVRLWLDLWFNKINASSVHGARVNPMYFGIHYTGWALWGTGIAGQWEPMYKNESQAAAFDNLQDANGVENVTSPMLTCMKSEQILVMNDNTYALEGLEPLHYNYTIQITNWDVLEPKLSPTRNMEGVNTPLIVEPLLPDKTASSFWAPIYAALQSVGGWIFKAFASLAEVVWQAVRAQFPWFAEWVDNINAALANGVEISNQMLSGIVELLKMVGGQVWIFGFITDFIQQTWEFLYPLLEPFTTNSTVWLTLLIIVFGILPIADNLTRGRWDLVQDDLEMIWGFMRTIIVGIYVIVSTLVGWLISALPL